MIANMVSVNKKLAVYGKVVKENLELETLFLGNLEVTEINVTSEVLFNLLWSFLQARGVSLNKVIGFGKDRASIMTGSKSGVPTRFKQVSPHCISIHCIDI